MATFDQREQTVSGVQVNAGDRVLHAGDEFRVIACAENSNTIVLLETGDYAQAVKLYNNTPLGHYTYISIQISFRTWERLAHKELPD